LWRKYLELLCDFQVFLPHISTPSGSMVIKTIALADKIEKSIGHDRRATAGPRKEVGDSQLFTG
jgi:hypothetical protein